MYFLFPLMACIIYNCLPCILSICLLVYLCYKCYLPPYLQQFKTSFWTSCLAIGNWLIIHIDSILTSHFMISNTRVWLSDLPVNSSLLLSGYEFNFPQWLFQTCPVHLNFLSSFPSTWELRNNMHRRKNQDLVVNNVKFVDCGAFGKQCDFSNPQMLLLIFVNERNITFLKRLW